MDGDDISLPTRFEKQVKFLDENPKYALVSCPMYMFDANGKWGETKAKAFPSKEDVINDIDEVIMKAYPDTEFDWFNNIRVVNKAQDIVVGCSSLLLSSKILREVSDGVTFYLHTGSVPGEPGSGGGVNPGCVIHKIGRKGGILNLGILQIPGQLVNDGADHLQVPQFFGTCRGGAMEERVQNPCGARLWVVEQRRNGECAKTGLAV